MKEQELDKYLDKVVTVVWFDNKSRTGRLHKVVNHQVTRNSIVELHAVKNGYYLECFDTGYDFCKSSCKKVL